MAKNSPSPQKQMYLQIGLRYRKSVVLLAREVILCAAFTYPARGLAANRGQKQLFYFFAGLSAPPQKLIFTKRDSSDK